MMTPKQLVICAIGSFTTLFVLIHIFYTETDTSYFMPIALRDSVLRKPSYPIEVAILIFATGKYIKFAEVFVKSMRKYFDCPICNVTYVIFSDNALTKPADDILMIPYKLVGWPYDTLKRVHAFQNAKKQLAHVNYFLAIDADMRARSRIGMEIFGDRVATLHPAFYHNKFRGTFENNTHSSAYVDPSEGSQYFAGGVYGGRAKEFWALCEGVSRLIDADLAHDYIALWHDESYLNRYLVTNPPTIILSPAYCSPERWGLPYEAKIVARTKRHSVARS